MSRESRIYYGDVLDIVELDSLEVVFMQMNFFVSLACHSTRQIHVNYVYGLGVCHVLCGAVLS